MRLLFHILLVAACIRRWKAVRNWRWEKRQARRLFDMLVRELGGKCVRCSSFEALGINHIDGRTWRVADVPWVKRVKRYWAEYRAGVRLNVMCARCNGGYRPNGWRGSRQKRRVAATPRRQRDLFDEAA